jgi:hypothetical protein
VVAEELIRWPITGVGTEDPHHCVIVVAFAAGAAMRGEANNSRVAEAGAGYVAFRGHL